MRIWYFINALSVLGLAFTVAFFVLAIVSPDTIAHTVCSLRFDSVDGYATCRSEL